MGECNSACASVGRMSETKYPSHRYIIFVMSPPFRSPVASPSVTVCKVTNAHSPLQFLSAVTLCHYPCISTSMSTYARLALNLLGVEPCGHSRIERTESLIMSLTFPKLLAPSFTVALIETRVAKWAT